MGAITLLRRSMYWGMYYCVALGSYSTCFEFNDSIVIRYSRSIPRFLGRRILRPVNRQVALYELEQVGREFVLRRILGQGLRCFQVSSLMDAIVKHICVRYFFCKPLTHQYGPSNTR